MFKIFSILREFCFAALREVQSRSSVQKHKSICYIKKEPTAVFCRCYKNHLVVNYPTIVFYFPLITSRYKFWKVLNFENTSPMIAKFFLIIHDSPLQFVGYILISIFLTIQKMIDFLHGKLIFVKVIYYIPFH